MNNTVRFLLITFLIAVICICGYELWKISGQYIHEAQVRDSIKKYRPAENTAAVETEPTAAAETPERKKINRFITDLQNDINKDIIGWITIPDTQIDYPFVISKDNDFYLRRDLYGNYSTAGTLFADYRCSPDFSDFNTIIYGHTMQNGSMFGGLRLFADEGFFDSNRYGTIFLKDNTYTIEFFAYMVIRADDKVIYNNQPASAERGEFFEYARLNALNYRAPETYESDGINKIHNIYDNVVTLSTCSYQFNNARIALLAIIN